VQKALNLKHTSLPVAYVMPLSDSADVLRHIDIICFAETWHNIDLVARGVYPPKPIKQTFPLPFQFPLIFTPISSSPPPLPLIQPRGLGKLAHFNLKMWYLVAIILTIFRLIDYLNHAIYWFIPAFIPPPEISMNHRASLLSPFRWLLRQLQPTVQSSMLLTCPTTTP